MDTTWRGDHGLSYELLWAFWRQFELILLLKQIAQIPQNLLLARVKRGRRRTYVQIGVVDALLQGFAFADKWSR